ncbi:MAG: SCO family protein [Nitrospinota bacterium]
MKDRLRRAGARFLVFLLLAAGSLGETSSAHVLPGQKGRPQSWREEKGIAAPDFRLTDQDGRRVSLSDLRGKVVLVTFIYTSCADLCPLITAKVAVLERRFRDRGRIHFVSVTTDPEVDTPAALRAYGKRFGADFSRWSFLTGTEGAVKEVWKAYGVNVIRLGRGNVEHNYLTALIDASGVWRAAYHGESWETADVGEEIDRLAGTPRR